MAKIELRDIKISDAKDIARIVSNPNFIYNGNHPRTVKYNKESLRKYKVARKDGSRNRCFAILYRQRFVGFCGINVYTSPTVDHICSFGYHIEEKYWGRGFATEAVKLLENEAFGSLGIKRIEVVMAVQNIASVKVVEKCGYKCEGTMAQWLNCKGNLYDSYLYAKVRE